jgi:capsular exopolysaccharide synthesis family protein
VSPIEVARILWRRAGLLLTVLAMGMAASVAATLLLPRSYVARAALLIEPRLEPSPDGSGAVVPILPDSATVDSLVQVLGSRAMVREVIDQLGLVADPELRRDGDGSPVDAFVARLRVTREGKSHVIAVAYRSADPARAARIVNALGERFVVDRLQQRHEASRRATRLLDERLAALKERLEASQAALAAAQRAAGGVDDAASLPAEIAQLRKDLAVATADRASRERKLERLRQEIRDRGADAAIADARSSLLEHLNALKVGLLRREADMVGQLGARHPRLIDVRAERAELQAKIRQEQQAIVELLAAELEGAEAKERALAGVLGELEARAAARARALAERATLERQVESDRRLYESQLARVRGAAELSGSLAADARVISEATPPTAASFPRPAPLLTVGFCASLLVALLAVYATEQADRRLRTPDDVRAALGLATLGLVPELGRRRGQGVPFHEWPLRRPGTCEAEAVRSVLTALGPVGPQAGGRIVLLGSAVPGEGKSSLTLALGRLAAEEGARVLVVDADLRRPSLAAMLGREAGLGLVELADGRATLDEVLLDDPLSLLRILPGSAATGPPTGLLGEGGVPAVLRALRGIFDLVLVDTAPLLPVADAARLAAHADAIVLVVRWARTPAPLVAHAQGLLGPARERVIGAVLTRVDLRRHRAWATADVALAYGRYRGYYTG